MDYQEFINILPSILTIITAITSCIACYLTYSTTRPALKIKVNKNKNNALNFINGYSKTPYAISFFSVTNFSNIPGCIIDCYLKIGKKEYPANNLIFNDSKFPTMTIKDENNNVIDQSKLNLQVPIRIEGNSEVSGYLIFPNLDNTVIKNLTRATIVFVISRRYFNKIRFFRTFIKYTGKTITNEIPKNNAK